jgi:predicted RNA-binding Zn ribbon-like protein
MAGDARLSLGVPQPTRPSIPDEPPPDLAAILHLVNTRDVETGRDELATPAQLRAFAASHGLGRLSPTPADVARAVRLREALRQLLLRNNGEPWERHAIAELNGVSAEIGMVLDFDDRGGATVRPRGRGVDLALGRLLATVYLSIHHGTWPRLKACREATCVAAFWDCSRNLSRTWCDMAVCGNRTKARRYRERARANTA